MDDSLYGDESPADKPEENASVDEENAEEPTALLPMSALGGNAKVGDMLTLKVLKLHGDEVEVSIASSSDDEAGETESYGDEDMDMDTDKMMET